MAFVIIIDGGQMVARPDYERCFDGMKNVEEELGPRSLEVDAVGCLVEQLEGEELPDF